MSKKKPYRYLLYLLLRFVEWLSVDLPRPLILGLMGFAAQVIWLILPKERKKVLAHLKIAFGDTKTSKEYRQIGKAVFQNMAWTAVDTLRIPVYKKKHLKESIITADPEVFKKIDLARSKGKGIICLTGHIGNWELATFYMTDSGYRIGVIGQRIYYEPFNRVLEKVRRVCEAKIFYRNESPKEVLKTLRDNEMIGILPDQDIDSIEGIFVDFFGKPAYTPTGPARISLTSGAPILPVFMLRDGTRYNFFAHDLIWPEVKTTKEEAVVEITKKWSSAVESVIKQYPEQWVWMHKRWKTQPESSNN